MRHARISALVSVPGIAMALVGVASFAFGNTEKGIYDKVPAIAPPLPPPAAPGAGAAPIVYSALPPSSAPSSAAGHKPYIQPIPGPPGPAFSAPGSSQPRWTRTLRLGFFERRALRNENSRLAAINKRVATLQQQNKALQNKMALIAKEVNKRAGTTSGPVTGQQRKDNLRKIADLKRDNLQRDARSNPRLQASLDRKLAAVDRKLATGIKAVDASARKDTKANDKLIAKAAGYAKSITKNNVTIRQQEIKRKR